MRVLVSENTVEGSGGSKQLKVGSHVLKKNKPLPVQELRHWYTCGKIHTLMYRTSVEETCEFLEMMTKTKSYEIFALGNERQN